MMPPIVHDHEMCHDNGIRLKNINDLSDLDEFVFNSSLIEAFLGLGRVDMDV